MHHRRTVEIFDCPGCPSTHICTVAIPLLKHKTPMRLSAERVECGAVKLSAVECSAVELSGVKCSRVQCRGNSGHGVIHELRTENIPREKGPYFADADNCLALVHTRLDFNRSVCRKTLRAQLTGRLCACVGRQSGHNSPDDCSLSDRCPCTH